MGFSRLAQHQVITKAAAKAAIQARCLTTFIYVAVCGTVTVPLCPFKLPGQLFPPLVPVVRPDKEDSSVMRGWGRGVGVMALVGIHGVIALPLKLPITPFKGVPRGLLCLRVRHTAELLS